MVCCVPREVLEADRPGQADRLAQEVEARARRAPGAAPAPRAAAGEGGPDARQVERPPRGSRASQSRASAAGARRRDQRGRAAEAVEDPLADQPLGAGGGAVRAARAPPPGSSPERITIIESKPEPKCLPHLHGDLDAPVAGAAAWSSCSRRTGCARRAPSATSGERQRRRPGRRPGWRMHSAVRRLVPKLCRIELRLRLRASRGGPRSRPASRAGARGPRSCRGGCRCR